MVWIATLAQDAMVEWRFIESPKIVHIQALNRRWIACDLGRFAIHTTRKRLLGIPNVKPFAVQNLGKYERQQWQVAEFPANGKNRLEEQKERETAYRKFILELYHATPISGHAEARVDASFKKIPREVLEKKAVEQGDVHFFELGALSVDAKTKKRELTLTLSEFVIPLDDVPEEVRGAIKHWSQMVDYWAVDWDFKDDTFHNQWQSYRTRKNPNLELAVKHEYLDPGKYPVVIKVIDIMGNDTTKTLSVEVK